MCDNTSKRSGGEQYRKRKKEDEGECKKYQKIYSYLKVSEIEISKNKSTNMVKRAALKNKIRLLKVWNVDFEEKEATDQTADCGNKNASKH